MPAAVDMRSAESKAQIEDLMNNGSKKQMVFGQYFGGAKVGRRVGVAVMKIIHY
jgi:hypothetical protein